MHVRRETFADHDAVRAVHRAAFGPRAGQRQEDLVEARLTDELRADAGFLPHLSLVAVRADVVVGHVIATRGWLEPPGIPALGIGPLGVRPEEQGRGVGSALVHSLLAVAESAGERLAVLLGDPGFYGRFDFRPAAELGITAPAPAWDPHFLARWLAGPPVAGRFRYAAPFDRL